MGRPALVALIVLAAAIAACANRPGAAEISREHAIEIARREVSFEPDRIEAIRATSGMTLVWRVTLTGRRPGQPAELFDTVVVEIDRRGGTIVSISRP